MKKLVIGFYLVIVSCILVINLTGCNATGISSTTTTTLGTAVLSGQVAVSSSDVAALGIQSASTSKPVFRTLANDGLADATVTLVKIKADGTEEDTGLSTTTDSSGNYSFSEVPALSSGVYKVVATKAGNTTVQVEALVAMDSATDTTANVAPETSIAASMFDDVVREDYGSSLIVEQSTMKELNSLVTDDTENLVTGEKLDLPSMQTTNSAQLETAAEGIAENNGNAEKAFKKLELENAGNTAQSNANLNAATKYINDLVLSGAGTDYLMPAIASQAWAQAYLDGTTKTASEVIAAADSATTGTTLNSATIIANINARLTAIKTKYDALAAGTADDPITEAEYFYFDATNPPTLTADTALTVPEQIALKTYIQTAELGATPAQVKANTGISLDDLLMVAGLGYHAGSTSALFEDVDLYYGSYGGWQVGGYVRIYMPASLTATITSVEVLNSSNAVVAVMPADGIDRYQLSHEDGPVVTAGTNNFTVRATLSDASTITTPVTLEMVAIPEPSLYKIDGTQIDDSLAPVAGDNTRLEYYKLPIINDVRQIFKWSTTELESVDIPDGYSWAYSTEIFIWGTEIGASGTLEVNLGTGGVDDGTRLDLSDTLRATMEYTNTNDLGALYTTNSFISPMDFMEEYAGQKIAYRFYLQRILRNAEGKYNGIAAGHFKYMRYEP
ncbi:MAG: carboxypeptidase-like regulatory domain-containing protein [bacterium]